MNKKVVIYFILVGIIIYYASFVTNSFTFEPFYSQYADSDQLYFLQRLNDDSLFKTDLFSILFCKHYLLSPTAVIYKVLLYMFSLPVATKVLSIILCLLSTIVVYRIGIYLYSQRYAFLLSSMFLVYFLSTDIFSGGQSRCFGGFIFCFFWYLAIKEEFLFLPFLLAMSIFLYPSLSVTLTISCILIALIWYKKLIYLKLWKRYMAFMSMNLIFFFFIRLYLHAFFENLKIVQNDKYVKYIPGEGIFNLLHKDPLDIVLNLVLNFNEHSKLYLYFTLFFLIISLCVIVVRKREAFRLPKAIWIMLLASTIGFFITYPVHVTTASRQFMFSVPFFLVFFVSTNVFQLTKKYTGNAAYLWLPLLVVFLVFHPKFNDTESFKKYKTSYDYINTLQKNTIIAGHPNSPLIKSIPFFSKRTIFFVDEVRDQWLCVYNVKELKRMHQDLVVAFYAEKIETVKTFISKYNIDYFVVEGCFYEADKLLFDRISNSLYPSDIAIYNPIIQHEKDSSAFILLQLAKRLYGFKSKEGDYDIFIVSAKKILKEN